MRKAGIIASALLIFTFLAGYGFYLSSAADTSSKQAAGKDANPTKQPEA
jgi:hypothetical protein